jgi:hypothetical protein
MIVALDEPNAAQRAARHASNFQSIEEKTSGANELHPH